MFKLRYILLFLFTMMLAGCGPVYQTYYTYQAPASLQARQCIVQCQQAENTCDQTCDSRYYQCKSLAMQQARFQYREYVNQQRLSHQPITQSLSSFYNPGMCVDTCGCKIKYNNCYTLCGGTVWVRKRCVAFCGKNTQ